MNGSDDDELELRAERRPRAAAPEAKRAASRLPIKTQAGGVMQAAGRALTALDVKVVKPARPASESEDDSSEGGGEEAEEEEEEEEDGAEEEPLGKKTTTTAEGPSWPAIKLELATLGSKILADPENALKEKLLDRMFELAEESRSIKCRRMALLSLLAIFKDITPEYRIRIVTEKEEQGPVSKQVRQTRAFEKRLLDAYTRMVKLISSIVSAAPWESGKNALPLSLCRTAATCLAELAAAKPDFNLGDQLVSGVVQRMSCSDDLTSRICCTAAATLMRNDASFKRALDIVRVLNKALEYKGSIAPAAVRSLLELNLNADVNDVRALAKEKKLKKQRRDKRRRVGADVMEALEEADALQSDRHLTVARQTELLREVFTLYLRLVNNFTQSDVRVGEPLVSEAVRGLAKVLPFLNPAYVRALLAVIAGFQRLPAGVHVRLEAVSLGLVALHLPGDEVSFDSAVLATIFLECVALAEDPHIPMVVRCTQQMFLKTRAMDVTVAARSVDALLSGAARMGPVNAALALVAVARQVVLRYPALVDFVVGHADAREAEEIPCGPIIPVVVPGGNLDVGSTAHVYQWRLLSLRHWHPSVRALASAGLRGKPLGQGESPMELFRLYEGVGDTQSQVFRGPPVPSAIRSSSRKSAKARKPAATSVSNPSRPAQAKGKPGLASKPF